MSPPRTVSAEDVVQRFIAATSIVWPARMDHDIETVASFMKGPRRAKFLGSIDILRTSVSQGSWVPRGKVKSESGFYQGLVKKPEISMSFRERRFDLEMCLEYGKPYRGEIAEVANAPAPAVEAWVRLCNAAAALRHALDNARPKPVVTPIGLSPKVTKTLTEMNLDIDLSTVKPAEIVMVEYPAHDREGKPRIAPDGKPMMLTWPVVKWTPGIKLHESRFHVGNGQCEACGKPIRSGRYVPIEAHCKKIGLIGLWVGVDCARNIFGVKDAGIPLEGPPKPAG